MQKWNIVLSYDVQKKFTVEADSEEEAYKKAYDWNYINVNDDWEYRDHIETTKIQECPNCDSGKIPHILYDSMGISCGYVCDNCEEDKKSKYNPNIFKQDTTDYRRNAMECGESIEPDE